MNSQAKIAVIGSYAVGMTMMCKDFPIGGETVPGHDFVAIHGGKGSNQAVAARRAGGNVLYGGCVGNDSFGDAAIRLHEDEGIDTRFFLRSKKSMSTGVGFVIVNGKGENEIVIDFGASNEVDRAHIDSMIPELKQCSLLLMQMEIGMDALLYAAQRCREIGLPFVLNPAPFQPLPEGLIGLCDYFTPNQTEARQVLGLSSDDPTDDAEIAKRIHALGVSNVVMTLGSDGAMIVNDEICKRVPGIKVETVDSTGAGDTFSAAFCVGLSEGKSLEEAVAFANVAAGLSVTKYGVIEGIPFRSEIDAYISSH